ncbi:hypothetical protein [Opitutus terrae]|uniref:Lipoprotein n=1 Tax=Opitutus terrae (strain DSM 11246 / JCM 15787 / PB90-1) TaxID=452637 RepID=B1ZPH5_OPITP|nr:hypothetical protein [Opitutus terrae]ACB74494.1 hypothetical protein Oter_1208 [Opitutus terrae PB90-1]
MSMHRVYFLFVVLSAAGCATSRPVADATVSAVDAAPTARIREAAATQLVETRYEIRGYRDADDPCVRHEPHAVYRATRLPAGRSEGAWLTTVPRSAFAPASYAPLPPSDELAAELAAQRQITAELRAVRATIATTEQQAQAQFGRLVTQAAETVTLRRQLEQERARVQELEARLRGPRPATSSPATASSATSSGGQPRW